MPRRGPYHKWGTSPSSVYRRDRELREAAEAFAGAGVWVVGKTTHSTITLQRVDDDGEEEAAAELLTQAPTKSFGSLVVLQR